MPSTAVIDSGPLIALFDKSDQYHKRSVAFLKRYEGKLVSTVAVLTEVSHLLDFHVQTQIDFLSWVAQGAIDIVPLGPPDLQRICELTTKYADVPMDFADASLVVVAEKLKIKKVISLDSDFLIYRTLSGGHLENLLRR